MTKSVTKTEFSISMLISLFKSCTIILQHVRDERWPVEGEAEKMEMRLFMGPWGKIGGIGIG